jgi:glycosyltransferase involved in cell wall biosynthesis
MSAPLFTILIPTFNRRDLVVHAINSVLKQTFDDFDIIVCDNFSTDDTGEVVRGFTDPRIRYVRTPEHFVVSRNWEFARSKANGRLILLLGDDDALVDTALECFANEFRRHDADFLFCKLAEYRDAGFPGPGRNTVSCPRFLGTSRVISAEEFLRPLFSFRVHFDLHPTAFVFAKALADLVASRCGRFFQTNGVEYCSWPLAAVLAKKIVYIDAPLTILGRTGKSWGSNLALANPGKEQIEQIIADFEEPYHCAPLTNFTMYNHWFEGLLTAKKLLSTEFGGYDLDEAQYLRLTAKELANRRSLGVDVSREINELLEYLRKYPSLMEEVSPQLAERKKTLRQRSRSWIGSLGIGALRRRMQAYENARKVKQGEVRSGFNVSGADFRFYDILGCAAFLKRVVSAPSTQ